MMFQSSKPVENEQNRTEQKMDKSRKKSSTKWTNGKWTNNRSVGYAKIKTRINKKKQTKFHANSHKMNK